MEVKPNHPLSEIIAKKLFGISNVPKAEQDKMINRACKSAVEYLNEDKAEYELTLFSRHKQEIIKARIEELEEIKSKSMKDYFIEKRIAKLKDS